MSERGAKRDRAAAYLRQPYVQAVERAYRAGAIGQRPGVVGHLWVLHDDDCSKLRGGCCNCKPELQVRYEPAGGAP